MVSFVTPAWMPALLFAALLPLTGCGLLSRRDAAEPASAAAPVSGGESPRSQRDAFSVEVVAPDSVRDYLRLNLEIQRYRQLDDLGAAEVSRLMVAAEANARALLGTLGYFTPTLTLELRDTPDDKAAQRQVKITVEPGERTRVGQVRIDFSGPIADDTQAEAQRNAIRADWALKPGQPFSQSDWDNAKNAALRRMTAQRYPTGQLLTSRADIDADRATAQLGATYTSGPAYRFGLLQVRGSDRYDPDAARRIARVPVGADYDQQKLLDAQQRLASSGFYDSVFLTLDTDGTDPQWAPVIAQVREAPLQKVVLGVGVTTDSGPRISLDHNHNRMPLLGWRAVSKISLDRKTKTLSTDWTSIPDDDGWRRFASGRIQREASGSYEVDSGRLRGGLAKASDRIDRSYFLQYDIATNRGTGAPPSASALSLNWSWTGRYFDDNGTPRRGNGLAVELGAGYTLTGPRLPFLRSYVRWLGIVPLGSAGPDAESAARRSRLALRLEGGIVSAKQEAQIPATLMFLTGGDTTVRGYSYRQIGTVRADGTTVAGRYLAVASVEWQRPWLIDGRPSDWESTMFVVAGAVADKPGELRAKVGVGAGVRWRSPVGPVQADLAYGIDVKRFRLHLRLGFNF